MITVGVDLAAKESNPTGICVLDDKIVVETVYTDREIVERIYGYKITKNAYFSNFQFLQEGLTTLKSYN